VEPIGTLGEGTIYTIYVCFCWIWFMFPHPPVV
jgi:hypothetical protein